MYLYAILLYLKENYAKMTRGDYMKLVSWNVNGIRACVNKGFYEYFERVDADVFCIQESKMQEGQLELITPYHYQYFNSAEKKGYSGVIIFSKVKPMNVIYDIEVEAHSHEGRVVTLEFEQYYFVGVYTPNAQEKLKRIEYRLQWEQDFNTYVANLKTKKPVVICGDLNVAHTAIDLKNPSSNKNNPGFSQQERDAFTSLLESGFIDTYRYLYPDQIGSYSWWSYRFNARTNNTGWRIDYFLVSNELEDNIVAASIDSEILGSDHCPVVLELSL